MALIISVLFILAVAPMVVKMFAGVIRWSKKRVMKTYETIMEIIKED